MAWTISNAMMKAYENSHSSRAQEEESLAVTCSDGEQSAQSSTTPMPDQYYWPDKTTEHSRLSRFGMTCVPLMESHGEDLLTWFRADFPARTSVQQEQAQGLKEQEADYGPKCGALLARFSPSESLWKTAQCSLLGDSEQFLETWPRWGSMHNGECYLRTESAAPTYERESGLLPTPRASVGTHGICWKRAKSGEHRSQIEDFLAWLSLNNGGQVVSGRTVNAEFQDWLMMWPTGWSALQPLETDKFQAWLQQHGGF